MATNHEVEFTLKLKDEMSQSARAITDAANSIAQSVGQLTKAMQGSAVVAKQAMDAQTAAIKKGATDTKQAMQEQAEAVKNSADKSKSSLKGLRGAMEKTASGAKKMGAEIKSALDFLRNQSPLSVWLGGAAFVGTIGAITSKLWDMGTAAVMTSSHFKQQEVALSVMLKDAGKAKQMMQDIEKFALATPFNTDDLLESTKMLTAFGFAADNVIPMMDAIGNAVGMMGGGQAQMNGIVLALGQIQAKGKLAGQELMQLTNQNISARKYLSEHFKKSSAEIDQMMSKGAISAKEAIAAIIEGMQRDFQGGMEKMEDTIPGKLSKIEESWTNLMRTMGDTLDESLDVKGKLEDVADALERFTTIMREKGLKDAWDDLVPPWVGYALAGIATLLGVVLVGALIALAGAIATTLGVAVGTVGAVAGAIAGLGGAIYLLWDNWEDVTAGVSALCDQWVIFFSNMADRVVAACMNMFARVLDAARPLANFIGMGLPSAVQSWSNDLKNSAKTLLQNVKARKGAQAQAQAQASTAWTNIKNRWSRQKAEIAKGVEKIAPEYDKNKNPDPNENDDKDKNPDPNANGDKTGTKTQGGGGGGGASRTENDLKRIAQRLKDTVRDLGNKVKSELGGAFVRGTIQLNSEIEKTGELIKEASEKGLDTSDLKAKLAEYTKVMREKLAREYEWIKREITLNIGDLRASATGNKQLETEIKYKRELLAIEKERERIRKEYSNGNNADEVNAIVDEYTKQAIAKAQREHQNATRENMQSEIDARKKILDAQYAMGQIAYNEMIAQKREYLEQERIIAQAIIDNDNATVQERAKAFEQLKSIHEELINQPQTFADAWRNSMQAAAQSLGDLGKAFKEFTDGITGSVQENFTNGFFEAMKGNFRGLADSFGDMAQSILQHIAKFLTSQLVAKFFGAIGGMFGGGGGSSSGFTPQFTWGSSLTLAGARAGGGPVDYGRAYLVGEHRPEVFVPDRPGKIMNADSAKAQQPIVNINITNQTGTEMKAQTHTRMDGSRYILDTVITAIGANQGGMRDIIKGVR